MKKLASAVTLALTVMVLGGCYHATITTGLTPSTQVIRKPWATGWLAGLVPPSDVEVREQCGTAGVARVETQISILNAVASWFTLSIYTPMQIDVTCAQGAAPSPAPASLTFEEYVKL